MYRFMEMHYSQVSWILILLPKPAVESVTSHLVKGRILMQTKKAGESPCKIIFIPVAVVLLLAILFHETDLYLKLPKVFIIMYSYFFKKKIAHITEQILRVPFACLLIACSTALCCLTASDDVSLGSQKIMTCMSDLVGL